MSSVEKIKTSLTAWLTCKFRHRGLKFEYLLRNSKKKSFVFFIYLFVETRCWRNLSAASSSLATTTKRTGSMTWLSTWIPTVRGTMSKRRMPSTTSGGTEWPSKTRPSLFWCLVWRYVVWNLWGGKFQVNYFQKEVWKSKISCGFVALRKLFLKTQNCSIFCLKVWTQGNFWFVYFLIWNSHVLIQILVASSSSISWFWISNLYHLYFSSLFQEFS